MGRNAKPNAEILKMPLEPSIKENIARLKKLFWENENNDIVFRNFKTLGKDACIIFVEGMADLTAINDFLIRPAIRHTEIPPQNEDLLEVLDTTVLSIGQSEKTETYRDLATQVLSGQTAFLIDTCAAALIYETRGFAKRSISSPKSESTVRGPQEGYVESLRTNLTMIHRYVHSETLVTEMLTVGTDVPLNISIVYLKGVADDVLVDRLRERIRKIDSPYVIGLGPLMQLIEDSPMSLFPQMMLTERPDRTASCLTAGQIAVMADNSPYALIAPVTLYHLIHASDDTYLRWQYGTFIRLVRIAAMFVSLFLPGLYIALTMYHSHLLPMDLLTAIAESRANVPFSIFSEMIIMEFAFFLLNEAGTRMPSQIGSALGIVGGLILGQAAVAASIVSPILIIIIALTGLCNYSVPNYSFSIGLELYRVGAIVIGALMGLYGLVLYGFALLTHLAGLQSLGEPFLAPVSPRFPHNPDIILRLPMWMQNRLMFFAQRRSWMRSQDKKQAQGSPAK